MNNTKQVTSLEISRKLKHLGVKQESEFFWTKALVNLGEDGIIEAEEYVLTSSGEIQILRNNLGYKGIDIYSAFISSELGEMLPNNVINYSKDGNQWCCVLGEPMPRQVHATFADTEADARGEMLIYLVEHGYKEGELL